jgi:hypothetical protein
MSHTPLYLTARDFDAYAPEKATSNAYSRPRLEVKQRALAWARGVVARLAELGIAVDVHGSDEHPSLRNRKRVDCQWIFFWRDTRAREELERLLDRGRSIASELDDPSPYQRHAFLALRLDASSIEVCFAVHPEAKVDLDNLRACLPLESASAQLMTALRSLPEQFSIALGPEERIPAGAVTPDALSALVDRAEASEVPIRIGWSVSRDAALEHSAATLGALGEPPEGAPTHTIDEQLEDAIIALAPIYRLIAWSRDNDHIALDRRIETAEEERARAHAEAEAQTERWREEQAEARRRSAELARPRVPLEGGPPARPGRLERPARRPALDTLFAPKPKAPVTTGDTPVPPAPKPPKPEPQPRADASAHPSASAGVIEKGAKVRVLSGPFADKVGVVGELDGRGGARVLLGLLSTRLEVAGLEPVLEGRERPPLQSSHRRPLAPAPRKAR